MKALQSIKESDFPSMAASEGANGRPKEEEEEEREREEVVDEVDEGNGNWVVKITPRDQAVKPGVQEQGSTLLI